MHPTSITADRARGILTVTWDDGKVSELPFKLLSDMCPCAVCSAERNNPAGLDREGCLRLQAEPPSLVKGATA
jgi:DUF971 family protein